jgi:hypothetical protein
MPSSSAPHNGLVAANLLADAGWDVVVLEIYSRLVVTDGPSHLRQRHRLPPRLRYPLVTLPLGARSGVPGPWRKDPACWA